MGRKMVVLNLSYQFNYYFYHCVYISLTCDMYQYYLILLNPSNYFQIYRLQGLRNWQDKNQETNQELIKNVV